MRPVCKPCAALGQHGRRRQDAGAKCGRAGRAGLQDRDLSGGHGAGGAAHLPGMVASLTTLPVIGVPIALKNLDGMDSLLSIVQMPVGVPVATVGVGNAKNAALLAARILGASDAAISAKVADGLKEINKIAKEKGENLNSRRNQKTGF